MKKNKNARAIDSQDALLRYIRAYQAKFNGSNPSVRQMAETFDASTSVINHRLGKLKERGLIDFKKGEARSVQVLGRAEVEIYTCPVKGCNLKSIVDAYCIDHPKRRMIKKTFREI